MKELTEITEKEWLSAAGGDTKREALLFVTPLCGTCKITERILQVVEAAGKSIPIRKININYAVQLRTKWQIASVPCLVVLEDGEPVQQTYAMHGVDYLFELLRSER
ncbi:thioredoxin-like negative regulator of GroEL [Paenibacillus phyllosphaerae]|uniref:Thioredoxin-like negative regulator of GroEL n=1 Tax=Paenibacillus phyllosphaerae TaxID=274593 RepID=A0A7W5B1C8_9BACL|nr:thioredoxin family protein [Paenibacillus phyllosphaerae]MBB3112553.1 thioredoxin-like negative regulator of GroEL [Paenibacillus phyllosphaerae]